MTATHCWFCGSSLDKTTTCSRCGMKPRSRQLARQLPREQQAYRRLAGWILGA